MYSARGGFIPVHPTLPAMPVGGDLSRSCNVHLILRPAVSVGVTDWVSPQEISATEAGDDESQSNSELPCRGKFQQVVTNLLRPLPIQPNGILLNQTPFILEETNFKPRTRPRSPGRRSDLNFENTRNSAASRASDCYPPREPFGISRKLPGCGSIR